MTTYEALAKTVIINNKNRLVSYDRSLKLVGKGRSAFVFKIMATNVVIKIFFPDYTFIAKEEATIYQELKGIPYFPKLYDSGLNYIVIDYIKGLTLFECITYGRIITSAHIKEIDHAISLARNLGLNPSDIHLRNIFITRNNEIKLIDVARFRQKKDCRQWENLKKAYYQFYCKYYLPKKMPAFFLNITAALYNRGLIPFYPR